jgi:GNAT superfamily N-acetyltransferase
MIIRKITLDDIPAVYGLVYELAVFEKEPESLIIDTDSYIEAFNEGIMDGHVCEVDKQIVGITVFYMTFSTWRGKCLYLEDFYIKPEFRNLGIGRRLFDAYIEECALKKCNQAKWQVLDWNETGLNFYKKYNAVIEKNWWNGKLYFK